MHELSIALSLVEAACEELEHDGGARLCTLHVRLGALSGVAREALLCSFDMATADTPIAGARLEIEDVPLRVMCPTCGLEGAPVSADQLRCAICGSAAPDVIHGRELELLSLDVEDDDDRDGADEDSDDGSEFAAYR